MNLACVLFAPPGGCISGTIATTVYQDAFIRELIADLGNAQFERREIATRSLGKLGDIALGRLRDVIVESQDMEIKRRAERLVHSIEREKLKREVADILACNHSSENRSARLINFIKPGMTQAEVNDLLELGPDLNMSVENSRQDRQLHFYFKPGLEIHYSNGIVDCVKAHKLSKPREQ